MLDKRNRKGLLLILFCALALMLAAGSAQAASTASVNKKAKARFEKNLRGAKGLMILKYADISGDGIVEALLECHPGPGSGRTFRIYTYNAKTGKAKRVLSLGEYGLAKIYAYPQTKALVLWGAGHGGEWYEYFRWKNGKYIRVAGRARTSKAGGGDVNGPWGYYVGSKDITKAKFNSKIKGLAKGTKKTVKMY